MKTCRLCGAKPIRIGGDVECVNPRCPLYQKLMPLGDWDNLGVHTSLRHVLSVVATLGIASVIICADVSVAASLRALFFWVVLSQLLMELIYEYL